MNNREKTLGTGVGLVAAVVVLYWGYGKYRDYNADLVKQKEKKQASINDINKEIKESAARKKRWQQYSSETLSKDPVRMQNIFRSEADQLLQECSLAEPSVQLQKLSPLGKNIRGQTQRVQVLSASVRGEGQVLNIMKFLYRVYSLPYMVRIKALTLTRPLGRNALRGELQMAATLETPLLPLTKMYILADNAKLEAHERKDVRRTAMPEFDDYRKGIVRRRLFDPYEQIVVKATNPMPAPGAVLYEETSVNLNWQPHKDAAEQKLFFGTGVPSTQPVITLNGAQRQFRPDEHLEIGKTYAWRVDTEFEDEVQTGDVWNFRVEKRPPPNVPTTQSGPIVVVPPPPDDAEFIVARMISSPLVQQTVLEDRRNPGAVADKRVEIGQALFDGILVYIHPKGAVSEKDGQLRLHPIGEPVRNLQPLVENDRRFPDVYFEVMKLKNKVAGINQGLETGG